MDVPDPIPDAELLARVGLLRLSGGNGRVLAAVLRGHGSVLAARNALAALPVDVGELLRGLPDNDAGLRALCREELAAMAHGMCVLQPDDAHWPPLLAETAGAPPLLFARGDIACLARPQVAIVGSRHASAYGLGLARAFARDLAAAGFVITSGLALGIDAAAHEGALAGGGRTIAVLGCGLDRCYPLRHRELAARIAGQGCLLGELPCGTAPLPAFFPQRNRIISGLSLGVLVVEAAPDSGSLITARMALEQGREVFAIPGSIRSPLSRGCHQLLRDGATLVETSAELVDALGHFVLPGHRVTPVVVDDPPGPEGDAARVLQALRPEGSAVDDVVQRTGLAGGCVAAQLTLLALQGNVVALAGGLWQPVR